MVMFVLVFAACQSPSSQTIASTTDTDGTLHPGELQMTHSAKVICISAQGANNSPAKCNVNNTLLAPTESTTVDRKLYLICDGTPPLRCTAEVQ
jgi:hypothetical protein